MGRITRMSVAGIAAGALLSLGLLPMGAAGAPSSGPDDVGAQIVGGTPIVPGSWPSLGPMYWYGIRQGTPPPAWWFRCGGNLIAPDWMVTAAHCVDGVQASDLQMAPGAVTRSTITADQLIPVDSIAIHPQWDAGRVIYDAALLHLARPSSQAVIPVAGPFDDASVVPGAPTITAGWGWLTWQGVLPDQAYEATVPVLDDSACAAVYTSYADGEWNAATDICAGYIQGGIDSCNGDSGGPLALTVQGERRLVGLVSYGEQCALPNYPGVYTRISAVRAWMAGTVGAHPGQVQGLGVSGSAPGAVTVSWSPPASNAWGITGYRVAVGTESRDVAATTLSASFSPDGPTTATVWPIWASGLGPAVTADVTAPPRVVTAARASGRARRGQALTVDTGTFSASPDPVIGVQWQRSLRSSGPWAEIHGATATRLTLGCADVGMHVRARVIATNPLGAAESPSNSLGAVTSSPCVLAAPRTTGRALVGALLSGRRGTWRGAGITFTYRWQRRTGSRWADVAGATARTYRATWEDLGHRLRVVVVGRNSLGRTSRAGNATSIVRTG